MKITGGQLQTRAKELLENPYYLAYALATGCETAGEAWKRDGYALPFTQWMRERWLEAAVRYNIASSGDAVGMNSHELAGWTAVSISRDQICDVLAEHVTEKTEAY